MRTNEEIINPVITKSSYYPSLTGLKFSADLIMVDLDDGRSVSVPLAWFPRLRKATSEQLNNFEIAFDGADVTWPDLDVDLSVESFINGLNDSCC